MIAKLVFLVFELFALHNFIEANETTDESNSILTTENMAYEPVNFAQVQDGLAANSITLIDVRNRDELVNDGKIPGSENVPLPEVQTAFALDESQFKNKYGFPKPKDGDNVIITCRSGRRAVTALDQLKGLGYNKNYKIYSGSFLDWVQNNGPVERV